MRFQHGINSLGNIDNELDLSQLFNLRIPIARNCNHQDNFKISERISDIELWTDGSLKTNSNQMGAGI